MDPASAFALAGTILQFIDSGSRFCKLAYQIHYAEAGGPEPWSDLRKLTQSFNDVLKAFKSSSNDTGEPESQYGGLAKVASECEEIGKVLLGRLQEVFVSSHSRKRHILKRAFEITFMEGEIKSLKS